MRTPSAAVSAFSVRRPSEGGQSIRTDRKSTRLNSSHRCISYAVFCLKKKKAVLQERSRDLVDVGVLTELYHFLRNHFLDRNHLVSMILVTVCRLAFYSLSTRHAWRLF